MDQIKLVPIGGVSLENIKAFFQAGAFGVGVGSNFLDKELIAKDDYPGLKDYFLKFKDEIREFIY